MYTLAFIPYLQITFLEFFEALVGCSEVFVTEAVAKDPATPRPSTTVTQEPSLISMPPSRVASQVRVHERSLFLHLFPPAFPVIHGRRYYLPTLRPVSFHHVFGRPLFLYPGISVLNTVLGMCSPSLLITCPYQFNRVSLILLKPAQCLSQDLDFFLKKELSNFFRELFAK